MTTRLVDLTPVDAKLQAKRFIAGDEASSSAVAAFEASLLEEEEKKPIPKVAFVVGLSAIAFTGGLTLTLLPTLKRSFQPVRRFSFLNNRHLIAPPPRIASQKLSIHPKPPSPLAARKGKGKAVAADDDDDFPMPKGEPISPLLALRAFAIATAGVLALAGLTTIAVAKVLDVRDMTEFTTKMRGMVSAKMPKLREGIHQPPPAAVYPDEATTGEESVVEGWLRKVVNDAEEERKALVLRPT